MKIVKKQVSNLKNGEIIASPVIFNGAIIVSKNTEIDDNIISRLNESKIKYVKIKKEDLAEPVEETGSQFNSLKNKFLNFNDNSNPVEVSSTIRRLGNFDNREFVDIIKIGFKKFSNVTIINELIIQCKRVNPDEELFNYLKSFLYSKDKNIVLSSIFILEKYRNIVGNFPFLLKAITATKDKDVVNRILEFFKSFPEEQIIPILKSMLKTTADNILKHAILFVLKIIIAKESTKNQKKKKGNIKKEKLPEFSEESKTSDYDYYVPSDIKVKDIKDAADVFKTNYIKANKSVEKIFTNMANNKAVDFSEIRNVVSSLVDEIFFNRDLVSRLRNIYVGDNYLCSHSINVCILSMLTAMFMDYETNNIAEIGIAALLADVGMMNVKDHVWKKQGVLSLDDIELIKYHVFDGLDLLKKSDELKDIIATVALMHHERLDGTGYLGFKGKDIVKHARIVAVCDVYDALTSIRSYRKSFSSYRALNYIVSNTPEKFDREVVRAFIKHIGVFPIGSKVLLSNGKEAVVTGTNNGYWFKPKINLEIDNLDEFNLKVEKDIFIKSIITGEDEQYEDWSCI
ncbi:MAG: HD-GYP domain-containing protein [Candidatus Muirbacterium halophilum]|nr:HD-GYP domain-containing protein [Candidatus Muirbacterium halophilum]MCK9476696.1 HD-GYP domain-containing protein [Candidatus Muirbacterium halophilum]